MASKFAHDLKTRGFNLMTHGPAPSMIRQMFEHVVIGDDPTLPSFDYGHAGACAITFVRDETGKAWLADGHVNLDDLKFVRATIRSRF